MDFATRDAYRHAVEEIARGSLLAEEQVAAEAVELARRNLAPRGESDSPAARTAHVGYYLVDAGRPILERAVAARLSVKRRLAVSAGRAPLFFYLGSIAIITAALTAPVFFWAARHGFPKWPLVAIAAPLALCASQIAIGLVNWLATILVHPRALPRIDFAKGVAAAHGTLVAVPTLLTELAEVDELLEDLEIRYLANRDPHVHFALVTDLRDAATQEMPADAALIQRARDGITALNAKYSAVDKADDSPSIGGGFFLFHRSRRWNEREGVWMGWERKRGKLEELNAFLRGKPHGFQVVAGPVDLLKDTRYVITLDTDTQLPRESARQLIGAMAHPLNRPVFDEKRGRVTEGYGFLQPRVADSMPSAARSNFARLFSGESGIDPYTRAVSDVYQDVFREGSFIGKGIYDIDAVALSLNHHLPENRILSHDLLEGAYARSALLSDVILIEEFPSAYPADISRRHRWMRGDWQIARWLLPRVPGHEGKSARNPISALSWWKIFDNLRRSVVPVCALAVLLVCWFVGQALLFTLLVAMAFFLPTLLVALHQLSRLAGGAGLKDRIRLTLRAALRQAVGQLFALACLPYEAFISLDAILRTAGRLLFTHHKLLEWRTARDAVRSARSSSAAGSYVSMWIQLAVVAGVSIAHLLLHREASVAETPLVVMWLFAPWWAWRISQPLPPPRVRLSPDDLAFLAKLTRRTWRFFDTFVGSEDNYLPPDNFQEDPPVGVAHRTSPTNIGLYLLANLAAHDFGYISAGRVVERTSRTVATMDKMHRYRGHLYNWYDTRTLEPLRPLYVSTVDSGNLAGSLLTLAAGLDEMRGQKLSIPSVIDGLSVTLSAAIDSARGATAAPEYLSSAAVHDILARLRRIQEELHNVPRNLSGLHALVLRLIAGIADTRHAVELRAGSDLRGWLAALGDQCQDIADDIVKIAPWVNLPRPNEMIWREGDPQRVSRLVQLQAFYRRLDDGLSLAETAQLEMSLLPLIDSLLPPAIPGHPPQEWFRQLRSGVVQAADRAAGRLGELRDLAERCREFADIDYEFLYDSTRRLLALGYNADAHRRDGGFYDLLASEARLGSFVAIAQGKLPQDHWFALGRHVTTAAGRSALLSWSGSMFEYLMPLLVMPTQSNTLLDETYCAVVKRQMEHGREHRLPWGISESGFNEIDAQLNYQYRAFGVPGLGFKRGLADDQVIAPYACVMGLMIAPRDSCANLRRLATAGFMGRFGFYEAVDYTPARLPPNQTHAVIRSYMAHHQAMSFLSLTYLLRERPMQRRFNSDPALRATELLLHERLPRTPSVFTPVDEVSEVRASPAGAAANLRVYSTPHTPVPEIHLLSNGRYHVAVSAAGGGYSRWGELAVTRWHEDVARDCHGLFCYLRDAATGEFWSTTHQPTLKPAASYEAVFLQGRAEFRRRDAAAGGRAAAAVAGSLEAIEDGSATIDTHVEIAVSPEDDIELRRVTLTNRGSVRRTIELTSYGEVVLATPAADAAHPAFSNMFVQTEILRQRHAILCTRRPRSAAEQPPWLFHLMTTEGKTAGPPSFATAREAFIGRGRTTADPAALHRPSLTDTEGAVLDPIIAIRNTVVIEPDETVRVNLIIGVTATRQAATELVEKYQDPHVAERILELAWTHSQVILRQLDATEAETQLYGRLAGAILYSNSLMRAPASLVARNRRGQSGLWGYGISGDLPIVLLKIGDRAKIDLVRQLVAAHAYWRVKGLSVDLVIWNEDQSGYRQALHDQIMGVIASRAESNLIDKPGGIFVRRADQMSEEDRLLMQSVARVILSDAAGTFAEQAGRRPSPQAPVARFSPLARRRSEAILTRSEKRRELALFNGIGGFTPDGREYVITTTPDRPTPAPWVNVLANADFGTVVTETGSAYTWCENAQSFRLTPWYNDAVTATGGEAFYIRDEESGAVWSPCPFPAAGSFPYTTRHGFGYSVFEYSDGDIESEMSTYVAADAPVKFVTIKLRNGSGRARRLSLTAFMEVVMGERRSKTLPHVVTETDPKTSALLARNCYNDEFRDRVAFLDCSQPARTVTGDRVEFLGRNGRLARPAGLLRSHLSGRTGAGLDPCAAMQAVIDLPAGQQVEVAFIFGAGRDLADAQNLISRFRGVEAAHTALAGVWDYWKRTLGAVFVETPDLTVNFLVNGWLLYQTLACRFWGRSGFYQSGGAFGFRDQLQDACAFLHAEPAILRQHLLRCAARQFREGDVQHWWHPPAGRGVRTRISDDYLWLPYAVCRYVGATGDTGVLDEKINFLEGRPVNETEDSYYDLPLRSDESATLYEHCVRAIKHGLRFGAHGLPLMGCGDWNDGMNLVGEHGKGESVWLAFFLHECLTQFADLARSHADAPFADICGAEAEKLRRNIDEHAWDGQWYTRAYFDNGQPLGSAENAECQIDSLPQSWATLANVGDPQRRAQALESMVSRLVNRDLRLIQLFDPAFDKSPLNPGYVKGYPPGVRENGGQYTHAAVWAVMAMAQSGDAQRAWELFQLINPLRHGDSEAAIKKYKVEPYVLAADVYTNLQHSGQGGWTWYTGSAGWMYRLLTESLLGLHLTPDRMRLAPVLPPGWESVTIHYRHRETVNHIHIRSHGGKTVTRVLFDGAEQPDDSFPLVDDHREHNVEVDL
ncbi:MAG: glucoamylase family protein [Tepidisphaeraceae bacterium]